jgi:diacylglycerol kinase family enzyme
MRLALLVNASASSVSPALCDIVTRALRADHEVEVADTHRRGHAGTLALDAARRGLDVVVVLGGDGTLNEAANGLAGSETALAPLPGGSTNVFARTLGYAPSVIEALGQLLVALDAGDFPKVGLGSANGRYFLFHAGAGFDARVIAEVEERSELKRYAGQPLFVLSALWTWARHWNRRQPPIALRAEGQHCPGGAHLVVCQRTDPYTFLGKLSIHLAPESTLAGPLALSALRRLGLGGTLLVLGTGIVAPSLLARIPWYWHRFPVRDAVLDARAGSEPFWWQVDGDVVGQTNHLQLQWEDEVMRLVVPPRPR